MKETLIKLLLKYKIIKYNFKQPLTFKSGIRSPIYCDFRACTGFPDLREVIIQMFDESVDDLGIKVIEGVSEGAIAYGALLGERLGLPSGFVRKDAKPKSYGLGKMVEGPDVSGKTVVLVEDLVTTAGSILNSALILKEAGASKIHLRAIFSYDFPRSKKAFAESDFEFQSLVTIHDVLPYLKEEKDITPLNYESLLDFIEDPEGWFDRHKTEFDFGFLTHLRREAERTGSIVSFGMDPILEALPAEYDCDILGFRRFLYDLFSEMHTRGVLPGMIKPNLGFYQIHDRPESSRFEGSEVLANIIRQWRNTGFLTTLDSKTGDIGKSSANYASVGFNIWGASALTVHGYMGTDSIEPYTAFCENNQRGVYILDKTSNSGSKDVQLQKLTDGKYLYELMGENIIKWAKGKPGVGAVIGGNSKEELFALAKQFAGKNIPILIPGVGAQGGSAKEVAQILREAGYELELARINSSSGLTHPWYSEKDKKSGLKTPSKYECIELCIHALNDLNEEIGYKAKALA